MMRQRISNADAAWLHMDRPTNLMIVNSVWLFDEPSIRGAFARSTPSGWSSATRASRQRVEHSSAADAGAELGR